MEFTLSLQNTYGWQAGGTHSTGMLSCFVICYFLFILVPISERRIARTSSRRRLSDSVTLFWISSAPTPEESSSPPHLEGTIPSSTPHSRANLTRMDATQVSRSIPWHDHVVLLFFNDRFSHISRLIRWFQQNKIHKNWETWPGIEPRSLAQLSTTLIIMLECYPCLCEVEIESYLCMVDSVQFVSLI